MIDGERRAGWAIAAAGAAAILVATLTPVPHALPPHFESHCWACGPAGGVDVFLNLLLFMPLGFGLGLTRRRWWIGLLACAGLSAFVELMQLTVVSGRDSSLSDWINNSTGGFAAFTFAAHWRAVAMPPARRAARLAAAWSVGVVLMFLGTGVLMKPDVEGPATARLRSSAANFLYYQGAVLGGEFVGTRVMPRGPDSLWTTTPGRAVTITAATPIEGSVEITSAVSTSDVAPVGGTFAGSRPLIILAEDRQWLMYSVRLRASRLLLRHPAVAVPRFFPPAEGGRGWTGRGDTVRVWGRLAGDTLRVGAVARGGTVERELVLSPFIGWEMFLFFSLYSGAALTALLTAVWVGGLLLPAAYWGERAAGRSSRGRAARAITPAAALIGVLGVPPLLGVTPAPWWVWAGAAAGLAAGAGLARAVPGRAEPDARSSGAAAG